METVANLIIRPTRYHPARSLYDPTHDLGPNVFSIKGLTCRRKDLEVDFIQITNDRSLQLKCSWFEPFSQKMQKTPCVVYCHGNCGNRVDAAEVLEPMLAAGISVFAFDFAGSGLSGGEYVSLGMFEQNDIHSVVTFLSRTNLVSSIALWGRSMGAVSAILYASTHRNISVLVLDSPFMSFREVTDDLANAYKLIPTSLATFFLEKVRKHVQRMAGFDMYEIKPIENIQRCDMPAMFMHARNDKLIRIKHSEALFKAYPHHEKMLVKVNGTHNSTRPKPAYAVAAQFLRKHMVKSMRRTMPPEDLDGLSTTRAGLPQMIRRVRERIKKTMMEVGEGRIETEVEMSK